MFTLKFVEGDKELLFTANSVRRESDELFYTDGHENEISMLHLAGKTVFVMNENGSTVSTYRF